MPRLAATATSPSPCSFAALRCISRWRWSQMLSDSARCSQAVLLLSSARLRSRFKRGRPGRCGVGTARQPSVPRAAGGPPDWTAWRGCNVAPACLSWEQFITHLLMGRHGPEPPAPELCSGTALNATAGRFGPIGRGDMCPDSSKRAHCASGQGPPSDLSQHDFQVDGFELAMRVADLPGPVNTLLVRSGRTLGLDIAAVPRPARRLAAARELAYGWIADLARSWTVSRTMHFVSHSPQYG